MRFAGQVTQESAVGMARVAGDQRSDDFRPYESHAQLNGLFEVIAVNDFQLELGGLLGVVVHARGAEAYIMDALNKPLASFVQSH